MKKKFLCLLICLIVITGCKSGKFNEENVNKEKNTFEVDYVSLSFADIYDVIGNGITNERYFELNPQYKEENLKDNDKVSLFIFASLSSLDNGEKDLYIPESLYNSMIPSKVLDLKLFFDEVYYTSSYEMNDYNSKLSKFWPNYKSGKNLDYNYVLYAGSNDAIHIVGLFSIRYHDVKKFMENNLDITLLWSNKYRVSFNGRNINKNLSINDIQKDLKNKGLID